MSVMRLNFISKELGMATNVTAILPSFDQNFDVGLSLGEVYAPEERFPVLWLLHGGSGDDADYLNWTNVARFAVEYNCAVICPCDYNAAYSDYPRGAKYYRYITEELREFIFSRFPILSDKREDNFIGGLSMGSGGAMKIAMDKCEQYSYALIMSGGFLPPARTVNGAAGKGHSEFRQKMISAGWAMPKQPYDVERANVMPIAQKNVEDGRPLPTMIMACGEGDPIAFHSSTFASQYLAELGYPVIKFTVPKLRHEWDFWEICMKKAFSEWLPLRRKVASEIIASAWNSDPE